MIPATNITCAVLHLDHAGNVIPCPQAHEAVPCPDCGDSRDCAACEGNGHRDGERCPACESLGLCPTCRDRYT